MLDDADSGAQCVSDEKSQATFDLDVAADGSIVVGSYGFGSGDALRAIDGGARLERTGVDKDVRDVVTYRRVEALPAWCLAQLEDL